VRSLRTDHLRLKQVERPQAPAFGAACGPLADTRHRIRVGGSCLAGDAVALGEGNGGPVHQRSANPDRRNRSERGRHVLASTRRSADGRRGGRRRIFSSTRRLSVGDSESNPLSTHASAPHYRRALPESVVWERNLRLVRLLHRGPNQARPPQSVGRSVGLAR
jgi:hypothetical protein